MYIHGNNATKPIYQQFLQRVDLQSLIQPMSFDCLLHFVFDKIAGNEKKMKCNSTVDSQRKDMRMIRYVHLIV